jgi:hypothetical protein
MATEGPLFRDGSQCTAFANYYNPGSALLGVNGSAQFLVMSIQAARVVQIAPSKASIPYGILQNTPMAGEAADIGIMGVSKAVAGAAITAGQEVTAGTGGTLGQVIPWVTSGYKIGMAIEAASAQGVVFTIWLYSGGIIL